jgi:hypothetical protein
MSRSNVPLTRVPEVNGLATANDECGEVTVNFSDEITSACGGTKVIKRTWKAVDYCGNVATALQTLTLRDTIPPVLTIPSDRTLECPATTETSATGVATATDACGSTAVTFTDTVTAGCGATKVIKRAWKAVDQCNNVAIGVQTITCERIQLRQVTYGPGESYAGMPGEHCDECDGRRDGHGCLRNSDGYFHGWRSCGLWWFEGHYAHLEGD